MVSVKVPNSSCLGSALKRRNGQLTHILISGMWAPDSTATPIPGQPSGKRVWVVKVVRREAVIGAHTFLLKEIYGLSSSSATANAHTHAHENYPPTAEDPYSSTPNECIVCLTSPRDVVLLPCRHLVVCRECAVGMVEFGAGGKVGRRDEGNGNAAETTETAPAAVPAPTTVTPVAVQPAGGTTATGRERRKKKAKGWYCPVCRQRKLLVFPSDVRLPTAYTSLLRLALPSTAARPPSPTPSVRAPSIRSFRSGRAPSIAPTLPTGAEVMLSRLHPEHESDGEDVEEAHAAPAAERPQFVIASEEDQAHGVSSTDKQETEHAEQAVPSGNVEEAKSKGWKEVA